MIKKTIYSIIILIGLNSCQSDDPVPPLPEPIDITTGLQVYFPFSGNANDVSGNGFDGTVFGNALLATDRKGNENSAYEFDGIDDYINTFSAFDFENRSLSLWINPSAIIGSGGSGNNTLTHVAISQDDNALEYGILRVDIDNTELKLWAGGITGTYTQAISENQWYHLVLIRNLNTTKYYLDGQLVGSGESDGAGSTFNPNGDFIIGAGRSGSNQFFKGKIDELRVYDIVLSEDQIEELFNN